MQAITTPKEYTKRNAEWTLMRDVLAGQKTMKEKGVAYIPKLSGQSDPEYKAYILRGYFFNATARVSDALLGMVFRRDLDLTAPKVLEELRDDIDLAGTSLDDFTQSVMREAINITHCGVLVDFPRVDPVTAPRTAEQAKSQNLRPYMRFYSAESIITWRTQTVNGKRSLALVVLKEETEEVDPKDELGTVCVKRFRVLDIDPAGNYRQRVYVEKDGKAMELAGEPVYPVQDGKNMRRIPFEMIGNPASIADVLQPLLLDLAYVNIAHYQNTVDMENGLHLTGLPTPYATGVTNTTLDFKLGSNTAWLFGEPTSKVGYLEFTGQGLEALRKGIQDKESLMASLGARVLAPEKKAVDNAQAEGMKRTGEMSVLASLAKEVSRMTTNSLKVMAEWMKAEGDVKATLNTDYNVARIDAPTIKALLESVVGGQISSQTFYETLVEGEAIKTTRTWEEEQSVITETLDVPPPPKTIAA